MAKSDLRLKRDVERVGELPNGIALYRYKYLWSDVAYVGVMAQEVETVVPEAVSRGDDGYLRVDYARLGISLQTWDQYQWAQSAPVPQMAWVRADAMQSWPGAPRACAAPPGDFALIVAALEERVAASLVR